MKKYNIDSIDIRITYLKQAANKIDFLSGNGSYDYIVWLENIITVAYNDDNINGLIEVRNNEKRR